jgi:hypothetical protein
MSCLVVKRHHRLEDGSLLIAGDELRPGIFDADAVNRLLDLDIVVECSSRLSYFALLHDFSLVEASSDHIPVANMFPELCIPQLDASNKQA